MLEITPYQYILRDLRFLYFQVASRKLLANTSTSSAFEHIIFLKNENRLPDLNGIFGNIEFKFLHFFSLK